jgi:hypothetical protein
MNPSDRSAFKAELDGLISKFFRAVSFESGSMPVYGAIPALFIERGMLIKNVGSTPEMSSVDEFIQPREALVRSGTLTRFHEAEISESTVIFGNVAHRFSAYAKSGTSSGVGFEARGARHDHHAVRQHARRLEDERHGVG